MDQAPKTPTTPEVTPSVEAKPSEVPKPAGETPPVEAKPDEAKSLLNEEEPAGAPDAYTDFKVPEGYTLDKATVEAAAPIFKKLNLSQEGAQELVDFYTKTAQAAVDKPYQDYLATRKGWQDSVKSEFGNQFPEVKATIGRALALLPAETQKGFREAMDLTGAGDHPAFVKAFYDLAKRATEGRPVSGRGPSPEGQNEPGKATRPTQAIALFPNLPSSAPQ